MLNTILGVSCPDNPILKNTADIELSGHGAGIRDWVVSGQNRKRCGMAIHLKDKINKYHRSVIGVLCGRWSCGVCGPYLRTKWLNHLSVVFGELESVYISHIIKSQWGTVQKRITRAGGNYAHIELASGVLVVFTNMVEGSLIPDDAVVDLLHLAIDAATSAHKAVATSRGWSLASTIERVDRTKWERVSRMSVSVDEVKMAVTKMGLKASTNFCYANSVGFYFNLSREWDDIRLSEFDQELDRLGRGGDCG